MMERQSLETNDTFLTPVLFSDGSDRRKSPRVPFESQVRVGPPYGAPNARVNAYDLSSGGIFIRSARPADLGATFSLELTLPSGETLYVAEAEVLYNRTEPRENLAGFAAKFTSLTDEVAAVIESGVCFPSEITQPDGGEVTESMIAGEDLAPPSLSPQPVELDTVDMYPRVSDLRLSIPVEPFEDFEDDEPLPAPELAESSIESAEDTDVMRTRKTLRSSKNRTRVVQRPRDRRARSGGSGRHPLIWGSLVGGAVVGILLAGAMIRSRSDQSVAHASAPTNVDRGMKGDTHDVLLGKRQQLAEPDPSVPTPALVAPRVNRPSRDDQPQAAVPAPAKAKPAPTKTKPAPTKATPAPAKTTPAPAKTTPAATKEASAPVAAQSMSIKIGQGAAVLRTAVLENPPRFMIDLVDPDQRPVVPEARDGVRRIRVGLHPGFTRIVVDTTQPIASARAERREGELDVQIQYAP